MVAKPERSAAGPGNGPVYNLDGLHIWAREELPLVPEGSLPVELVLPSESDALLHRWVAYKAPRAVAQKWEPFDSSHSAAECAAAAAREHRDTRAHVFVFDRANFAIWFTSWCAWSLAFGA